MPFCILKWFRIIELFAVSTAKAVHYKIYSNMININIVRDKIFLDKLKSLLTMLSKEYKCL